MNACNSTMRLEWRQNSTREMRPAAEVARALGIRPMAVRVQSILLGGLLAGLGGVVLSVDYTQTWAQDMRLSQFPDEEITSARGMVGAGANALLVAVDPGTGR
jgi:branched-subunit amino acid ABC-type transport system permease component